MKFSDRTRCLGIMLLALGFLLLMSPWGLRAEDQEGCLLCHGLPGFGYQSGEDFRSLYIVQEEFNSSNHGQLACRGCHRNILSIPHDSEGGKVNCGLDCHAVQPGSESVYSHESLYWNFMASVHGEEAKGAFGCLTCHPKNPSAFDPRTTSAMKAALCLGCHDDEKETTRFGLNKERMDYHMEDIHGRSLKAGSHRAATCPDCHTNHSILPSENEESSTHDARLSSTCSGAMNPAGEKGCHHRAATAKMIGMSPLSGIELVDFRGGRIFYTAILFFSIILMGRMVVGLMRGR